MEEDKRELLILNLGGQKHCTLSSELSDISDSFHWHFKMPSKRSSLMFNNLCYSTLETFCVSALYKLIAYCIVLCGTCSRECDNDDKVEVAVWSICTNCRVSTDVLCRPGDPIC